MREEDIMRQDIMPGDIRKIIEQINRNAATPEQIDQLHDFLKTPEFLDESRQRIYVKVEDFAEFFVNLPPGILSWQFKDLLVCLERDYKEIYEAMLSLSELNKGQSLFYASELWNHRAAKLSKWQYKEAQKYRARAAKYLGQALEKRHSIAILLSENTVSGFINEELHRLIVHQDQAEIGGLKEIIKQQAETINALKKKLEEQEQILGPLHSKPEKESSVRESSLHFEEEKKRDPTPPTRVNSESKRAEAEEKRQSVHLYVSLDESPIYGAQKPFTEELFEHSFFGGKRGRAFESSGEQEGGPSSAYKTPKLGFQEDDE